MWTCSFYGILPSAQMEGQQSASSVCFLVNQSLPLPKRLKLFKSFVWNRLLHFQRTTKFIDLLVSMCLAKKSITWIIEHASGIYISVYSHPFFLFLFFRTSHFEKANRSYKVAFIGFIHLGVV